MGYKRVSKDTWMQRASDVRARWISFPKTSNHHGALRCLQCGHDWQARGSNVAKKQGCPKCAGVLPVSAEIWKERAQKINAVWLELPEKATDRKKIRCLKCGFEWETFAYNVYSGCGCHRCAGREKTSVDTWYRRASAVGATWITVPASRGKRGVMCCNSCAHVWEVSGRSVCLGAGCPLCAKHGFKKNKPAFFYVLELSNGWVGYGITADIKKRFSQHRGVLKKINIAVVRHREFGFSNGAQCLSLENQLKFNFFGNRSTGLNASGFRTEAVNGWSFTHVCALAELIILGGLCQ